MVFADVVGSTALAEDLDPEDGRANTWQVERSLSLLAAYGRVPAGVPRLDAAITYAERRGLRPLPAQLLRLRSRATGSVDEARRAHQLLRACAMRADAALAAVEMASLGDASELVEARAELERVDDVRGPAAIGA